MSSILRHIVLWLSLGVFLALGFGLRCWNKPQVFHDGGVYFIDADCYSRMTRVLRVMEKPFSSIRFHEFENAPIGVYPHTTATMDLVIAGFAKAIAAGASVDTRQAADLAGAFVSPLLGALLIVFLWWWSWKLDLAYRNALLLLVAVSPILVHGFLLGRPDHQSLILLLVGIALAAEIGIWKQNTNGWKYLSAAAWGLALWTSLFEPLILLVATLLCRVLVQGRQAATVRHWPSVAVFIGILLLAVAFDGWRFRPGETTGEVFDRWALTIGELNHPGFTSLFQWTGFLLPIVPALLILRFTKEKCRVCLAMALLVLLTIGLTLWYARWGYFLALVFAMSLPMAFSAIPWRPAVWAVFLISLWPMAQEWDRQFFDDKAADRRAETRAEGAMLRQIAEHMKKADPGDKTGTVLAPWWISPSIAYWSGLPCVAGSSHQSLPGIVDSAKFYLSTSRVEAEELLKQRKVKWVVFDNEFTRVTGNSSQILGIKASPEATAVKRTGRFAEDSHLRLGTPYFEVYRVKDAP